MSIAAQNWALGMIAGKRVGRSASTKLVLWRFADRADPNGKCWPGHETTAVDLDISPSTVAAAIRELSNLGLLRIERSCDAAGRDLPNIYHLRLDLDPPPYPYARRDAFLARRRGRIPRVPESGTRDAESGRNGVPESGPETQTP